VIRRVLKGDISGRELYTETRSLNGWDASGDDAWRWTREYLDGLGRTYLTRAARAATRRTPSTSRRSSTTRPGEDGVARLLPGQPSPWVGYSYDLMGRVARTQYANGSVTTFARAIVPIRPVPARCEPRHLGQRGRHASAREITRYVDAQANLVRSVYADKAEVNFGYDVLNRAVKLSLPTEPSPT